MTKNMVALESLDQGQAGYPSWGLLRRELRRKPAFPPQAWEGWACPQSQLWTDQSSRLSLSTTSGSGLKSHKAEGWSWDLAAPVLWQGRLSAYWHWSAVAPETLCDPITYTALPPCSPHSSHTSHLPTRFSGTPSLYLQAALRGILILSPGLFLSFRLWLTCYPSQKGLL